MRRSLSVWTVSIISVALMIASTFASFGELIPFFRSGGAIEAKFDALSSGTLKPGMSIYSRNEFLDDCNYSLNSFSIVMLAEDIQNSIRRNCGVSASSIISEEPTFSYAWYIKALTSSAVDGSGDFEAALLQARRTAPNQEGLAYYRVMLAYNNWQYLDDDARQELSADIAVAAYSDRGRNWIALRYIDGGDFRETIINAMESAPENIKSLFLRKVRSISG